MTQDRETRTLLGMAFGGMAPIAVAAALVSVRSDIHSVNVALLLTVIVVAAAIFGGRGAGAVAAITSTLSFDFFFTRPYNHLTIDSQDDLETTILLLVVGLVVGHLAWRASAATEKAATGRSELGRIRRLADQVATGVEARDIICSAQGELSELLGLPHCRYEAAPFVDRFDRPELERDGTIVGARFRADDRGELELELPTGGFALPVLARGELVGRFVFDTEPGAGAGVEQRVLAVALADQVGASLAVYPPRLAAAGG